MAGENFVIASMTVSKPIFMLFEELVTKYIVQTSFLPNALQFFSELRFDRSL
jgi:hypothetical protein